MSNGHGGARPGAGRKPHSEKYASPIEAMRDRAADGLQDRMDALEQLASGGYEQISETWEPAGLIFVTKQVVTGEGTVSMKELAFPELPPEQLVCIRRTRSVAAPDRKANEYLIDRIAGRPTQAFDIDTDPDGTLEITAQAMDAAAKELAAWRQIQTEQLSSLSSPPMPPMPATPTA